jgi:outer membrane receptor protein involved in Fe transport
MIEILNMLFRRLLIIFCPVWVCCSAAVHAVEDYPPGPLEEIVVSALREKPVAELDASISVLDRETIESGALEHFQELIQLIPNMNLSGEGSRARYFQLRGIGELEQYEGAPNPSIGFIVDDIDLSGVGGISNLFDIQQLEVLRGPQATRFGANAIAGLVYVQSADADEQSGLNAQIMLGNDETRATGISVGGALGEGLNGRFSVHHFAGNGFYDNASLGVEDSNQRDELVGRGKLKWDLGNDWSARLTGLFANFNNGYDAWSPQNGRITYADNPGRDEQKTMGASLKFSGPLNAKTDFVSISGYASSDILFSYDGEWGDADYWQPYSYDYIYTDDRDRETLSQEFRVLNSPAGRILGGRADWLMGVYAQRLDESNHILSAGIYDDSVDAPFSYCTPCADRSSLESAYESDNYAVFAKLELDLKERLVLSVGARLERWKADYADAFADQINADPGQPARHVFSPQETLWGGDFSLNYELSAHSRAYALVSRGYKAGGFNPSLARALGQTPEQGSPSIAFDPEALWNYEAGVRGSWLDERLSGAFSLFYMDRRDMQLRSSAQFSDNPNDFVFITSNAQGHAWGLEASLELQLSSAWALHANLGLLESTVDAYRLEREAGIEAELTGRAFAHAPPYTLNLGISYYGGNPEPGNWVARLDLNALGSFYFDYSHDEKADAHYTINFRVGRQWRKWEVYGWVRNLLDESYPVRGFSFGLEPPWFERSRYTKLGDPRHYGLTVNYRY